MLTLVMLAGCAKTTEEQEIKAAAVAIEADSVVRKPRIISHELTAEEKLVGDSRYYCAITKHSKFDEAGNVLWTTEYEYLNKGQIVKASTESSPDGTKSVEEYAYNLDGNWTEHVKYTSEFQADEYARVEYNDHNDVVYKYDYLYGGGAEIVSEVYSEYEYDDAGHKVSYKTSQKPTVTYYVYDEYGSLVEEYSNNADGQKVTIYTYENKYDEMGRLVSMVIRYPDDTVEQMYEYTYYKDEPLQKKRKLQHYKEESLYYTCTEYAIDGTVTAQYSYSVDSDGNMVADSKEGYALKFDSDGKISEEIVYVPSIYYEKTEHVRTKFCYEYEYDADGNISKITLLNEQGDPTSYETWEYEKLKLIVAPKDDYEIGKKLKRHYK